MSVHEAQSDRGRFEVVIGENGAITDVVGDWPSEGEEFMLHGPLPEHVSVPDAPLEIQREAAKRGWEVCYYDGHCRICYCDGEGNMRCQGQC
jgi:hypothetical protein